MPRRRRAPGFTLVELMFVVLLIGTLGLLAFPSLRTFSGRDRDASVATFIVHEFNRVKAQAQMRGRLQIVQFSNFSAQQARGRMDVYESRVGGCEATIANLAQNAVLLARYGLGHTYGEAGAGFYNELPGGSDDFVGLLGFGPTGINAAAPQAALPLTLCILTDGSVRQLQNGALLPPGGRIALHVQRFQTNGPFGPARQVRFDVFQPARLEL